MKQNNIVCYTKFDDGFYAKMGKYFADKTIIKELDNQLYNEDNMVWYIYEENNVIKGFLSIQSIKNYYYIDNFYVLPEYRNNKIGSTLLDFVLDIFNDKKIKLITRNEIALRLYFSRGFKVVRKNGRYRYLEK